MRYTEHIPSKQENTMKKHLAAITLALVAGGALAGHPSIMSDKAFERQLKSCHTVTFTGVHQIDNVTYTSGTIVKYYKWIAAIGGQAYELKPFVLESAPGEISEADAAKLNETLRSMGETPCLVWQALANS
jgi:hypothetical protein